MLRDVSVSVAAGLALLLCGPVAASASAAEAPEKPVAPLGLVLAATNGYKAKVIAGSDPEKGRSAAILALSRKGSGATYATSVATVTASSIEARFGALGEIDVHLVETGGSTTERAPCNGRAATFPSGRWEGTVRFRGEGGFASIDATSARAAIRPYLELLCFDKVDEGIGGHAPGALLELRRHRAGESVELTVRKNKRVGPTRITAELSERRGKLEIDRSVSALAPSAAFDFEIPPGHATVAPPAPFAGALDLTRRPGSPPLVKGNLRVDLPGRPNVPVVGKGSIRASLVRAVLNPSHPF